MRLSSLPRWLVVSVELDLLIIWLAIKNMAHIIPMRYEVESRSITCSFLPTLFVAQILCIWLVRWLTRFVNYNQLLMIACFFRNHNLFWLKGFKLMANQLNSSLEPVLFIARISADFAEFGQEPILAMHFTQAGLRLSSTAQADSSFPSWPAVKILKGSWPANHGLN